MISVNEIHVYELRIETIVYDPVSFKRYVVAREAWNFQAWTNSFWKIDWWLWKK